MIAPSIITILKANAALTAKISDRIYPIIDIPEVVEGAALSAIYFSVAMYPKSTKNADFAVDHVITFVVVASGYLESWTISDLLRKALELKKGTFSGVDYHLDRCESIQDEYEFTPINMYGQKVTFNVRTKFY